MATLIEKKEFIIESSDGYRYRMYKEPEGAFQIIYEELSNEYSSGDYVERGRIGLPFKDMMEMMGKVLIEEAKNQMSEG